MDIRPYVVKYKGGTDKNVQPGIHGAFKTMEEAKAGLAACARFFGGGQVYETGMIVGRAVIGIVVDQGLLNQQRAAMNDRDDLPIEFEPEVDELQKLREENARLKASLGEPACEESFESEGPSTPKRGKRKEAAYTSSTSEA